jgi:hypothetical protein
MEKRGGKSHFRQTVLRLLEEFFGKMTKYFEGKKKNFFRGTCFPTKQKEEPLLSCSTI